MKAEKEETSWLLDVVGKGSVQASVQVQGMVYGVVRGRPRTPNVILAVLRG